jgi:hypothetical protein
MSDSHIYATDGRLVAGWIDEIVTLIRNRGFTREHAVHEAAARFGMSLGRVQNATYGRPITIRDQQELLRLRSRYAAALAEEDSFLLARRRALRAKRALINAADANLDDLRQASLAFGG